MDFSFTDSERELARASSSLTLLRDCHMSAQEMMNSTPVLSTHKHTHLVVYQMRETAVAGSVCPLSSSAPLHAVVEEKLVSSYPSSPAITARLQTSTVVVADLTLWRSALERAWSRSACASTSCSFNRLVERSGGRGG